MQPSAHNRASHPLAARCAQAACSAVAWDAGMPCSPHIDSESASQPSAVQPMASQAQRQFRESGNSARVLMCHAAAGPMRAVAGGNGAGRQPDHMGGRAHRPVGHRGALILLARQQPGMGAARHLGRSALSASASPASLHFDPRFCRFSHSFLVSFAACACRQWQGMVPSLSALCPSAALVPSQALSCFCDRSSVMHHVATALDKASSMQAWCCWCSATGCWMHG